MVVEVRGAVEGELSTVRGIISQAWSDPEDEPALWDYLAANHPGLHPECVRVTAADGQLVACVVVLPCRFRTPRGLVPGAEITLVACRPDHQRCGYGGATFRDALAYMAGRGLALAVFWGNPGFYGRFGCAPVLPIYRTTLDVNAASSSAVTNSPAPDAALSDRGLRPVTDSDLRGVAALYRWGLSGYLMATSRAAEPWLWRVRNPRLHALLVLGDLAGYAFVSEARGEDTLVVREASVQGGTSAGPGTAEAARRLLRGLLGEAGRRGLGRLRLSLPPDNPVAHLAVGWGAEQTYRPAGEGLAVVTSWEPLLPPGWQVVRNAGEVSGLALGARPILKADQTALTQLVVGYRGIDDLLLAGHAELTGEAGLAQLRVDFPTGHPRYFEAPYFFWL